MPRYNILILFLCWISQSSKTTLPIKTDFKSWSFSDNHSTLNFLIQILANASYWRSWYLTLSSNRRQIALVILSRNMTNAFTRNTLPISLDTLTRNLSQMQLWCPTREFTFFITSKLYNCNNWMSDIQYTQEILEMHRSVFVSKGNGRVILKCDRSVCD